LKGKGKTSHLTNDAPAEDDPTFKSWDEGDSMIMAWFWNSMGSRNQLHMFVSQFSKKPYGLQ